MNTKFFPNGVNTVPAALKNDLLQMSRRYGTDPDYVLAGGGNSSAKTADTMLVKASGTVMASMGSRDLVFMDLGRLEHIWSKQYPVGQDQREQAILQDMMQSRHPNQEDKRPSVETLLHALFPQKMVMHTHPALINGLTCAVNGRLAAKELFGDDALWIDEIEPGYLLAKEVKRVMQECLDADKTIPGIMLLENHGVFAAADTVEEIDFLYRRLSAAILKKIEHIPCSETFDFHAKGEEILHKILPNTTILPFKNPDILNFVTNEKSFFPLSSAFTPDHIVYAGFRPVYAQKAEQIPDKIRTYAAEDGGRNPMIVAVADEGAYAIHEDPVKAQNAKNLFADSVKIAVYAQVFGGSKPLSNLLISFIRNWEVEKYRASLSSNSPPCR